MKILCSLLLFACYATVSRAFLSFSEVPKLVVPDTNTTVHSEVGEPLLLTPYIETGRIEEAKKLSRVEPIFDAVQSYAGFFTVDKTSTRSHQYFWFFPNSNKSEQTPVILWLNGGPGCSSLIGLFTQNGPFEVVIEDGDKVSLKKRMSAWTNNYHVLYIDQPIGVGFSFSKIPSSVSLQEKVAEHLYQSLDQFYKLFPEYRNNGLYVAGESYAGKFVPAIAYKIHTANKEKSATTDRMPLKGMMIGNGFTDPENMLTFDEHMYGVGLIGEKEQMKIKAAQDVLKYNIRSGTNSVQIAGQAVLLLNAVSSSMGSVGLFDFTKDSGSEMVNNTYVKILEQVRQQIHVGSTKYVTCSKPVQYAFFLRDLARSVKPWIEELLENDYQMLFFNGLLDLTCSHLATENFIKQLHWKGAASYHGANQQMWMVDGKLAGYYKSGKNLAYVKVRNAGHQATQDQPEHVFDLINLFMEKKLTKSLYSEEITRASI